MEEIFEFIFEIIIEGTVELAKSRHVPLPLRILAALLIIALYGGMIFLIVWAGLASFNNSELNGGKTLGVLLFIGAFGLTVAVVWQFVKALRRHGGGKEE